MFYKRRKLITTTLNLNHYPLIHWNPSVPNTFSLKRKWATVESTYLTYRCYKIEKVVYEAIGYDDG